MRVDTDTLTHIELADYDKLPEVNKKIGKQTEIAVNQ